MGMAYLGGHDFPVGVSAYLSQLLSMAVNNATNATLLESYHAENAQAQEGLIAENVAGLEFSNVNRIRLSRDLLIKLDRPSHESQEQSSSTIGIKGLDSLA